MNTRHYYLRLLRTLALAALTAAATAACSDDSDDNDGREPVTPDGGIPVTFTANINPGSDANPAAAPGTRTILTPDNGGFTVKWKAKNDNPDSYDKIRIWAAQRNALFVSYGSVYVPIISDTSSALEPENPNEALTLPLTGEWKFTAIYGNDGFGSGNAPASISSLTQSAPGDTKHIAAADFSVATITQHVETGDMPDIGLQFHHLLSALQLQVKNGTGEALTVKEIRLSVTEGKITTYKEYGVIAKDWTAENEQTSDYLQLKASNFPALANDGTVQKFHMLLFPGYENKTLTITVITDRGDYTLTKGAPAGGFIAGKNYLTDITVRNSNLQANETWRVTIRTAEELKAFRDRVNNGTDNYQGKTIYLADNIYLADASWAPIGTDENKPFKGTFDGDGYHISGLNVNTTERNAGLFGCVDGGKVRNLRVSGTVTGTGWCTGGIVGYLSNSTVENCIFDGTVNGVNQAGGIVGANTTYSQIAGCYTKGTVRAGTAGGIIGTESGDSFFGDDTPLKDCYSSAVVEATGEWGGGGIAGMSHGMVTRCYATGAISAKSKAGGIVAVNFDDNGGVVENCIALNPSLTRTSGSTNWFGRIMSENTGTGTITNCAAFAGMTLPDGITATPAADGMHGSDLTREQCVTGATYPNYCISVDNGWAFDTGATWRYLPWNKAFESFRNISETDYRIEVPDHLKAPVIP